MKKNIVLLLAILSLYSCKKEFELTIPENKNVRLLELDKEVSDESTLSLIGDFSGKIQVKVVYIDGDYNVVKHGAGMMMAADEKTNGVYFKVPSGQGIEKFNIQLWINEEFYQNTFVFKEFIIRKDQTVLTIDKENFNDFFELKNMEFDRRTGLMKPLSFRPIPQIQFKGLLKSP